MHKILYTKYNNNIQSEISQVEFVRVYKPYLYLVEAKQLFLEDPRLKYNIFE